MSQLTVQPGGPLRGRVRVSGDKSISHRALLLGAIAEGASRVENFLPAADCLATLRAVRALGVEVEEHKPTTLIVHGRGLHGLREPDDVVDYSVKFSLGRFSHQPISTFGDFNGDGRPDLVLSVSKEGLGIHWGLEDDFWDNDYDFLLEDFLPTRGKGVRVADLDGDGRDDLIFVYNRNDIRQMPEVNHKFTVLLSRFGTPKQKIAGSP